MFEAIDSPYLVPFNGRFKVAKSPTSPPKDAPKKKEKELQLEKLTNELSELQHQLYADNRHAVLLVFQAMDAAGKDGTIRAVMSGINPAGCQVFSFKKPSDEELDHDFLWRTAKRLPERGRIGIFNRSYYEEVLIVRVHPGILEYQKLPTDCISKKVWDHRYESIRDHEKHLARNGTVVIKFWLNVSRDEQRDRFLARIEESEKNWKFAAGDVKEREHWDTYMSAYEDALSQTSRPWAPWYAIPADSKSYMRMSVAKIVVDTLKSLNLKYPKLSADELAEMKRLGKVLQENG